MATGSVTAQPVARARQSFGPPAPRLDATSGEPMAAQVYEWLLGTLVDGRFPPGTRLVQERLASELDVSRMPVREALSQLDREGYVTRTTGGGYVVRDLRVDEMREIYQVRQTLEPVALRLAFPHYTPQHLSFLRQLDAEGAAGFSGEAEYYESNRRLHLGLIAPCPNRLIVKVVSDLFDLPVNRLMSRRHTSQLRDVTAWRDEHTAIIDALAASDIDLAASLLASHLGGWRAT